MKKSLMMAIILLIIFITDFSYIALKKSNITNLNKNIAFCDLKLTDNESIQIIKNSLKDTYGDNYLEKITKNTTATKNSEFIELKFERDSFQNIIYPDNYGGTYINEDDELVIQIVGNSKNKKSLNYKFSSKTIDLNNEVLKEYVNFSYNDLVKVNDEITKYFLNNGVKNSNFVANYIDVFKNRVVIELYDISNKEQEKFKEEILDSNLIEFKLGQRISPTSTYKVGSEFLIERQYKKGGQTIYEKDAQCSIGAKAKRNGVIGYITAGHCFGFMDYTIDFANINIGTYVTRDYSQNMDAAFIKLNSGNSLSNDLSNTGWQASFINTTGSNYYTNGTKVGKDGFKGKFGNGQITSLNYSFTDADNYYHTGLISANITTLKGDSGGPVFIINTTTLKNGAPLIGITSGGGTNVLAFYDYNKIVTTLGLTKY